MGNGLPFLEVKWVNLSHPSPFDQARKKPIEVLMNRRILISLHVLVGGTKSKRVQKSNS